MKFSLNLYVKLRFESLKALNGTFPLFIKPICFWAPSLPPDKTIAMFFFMKLLPAPVI